MRYIILIFIALSCTDITEPVGKKYILEENKITMAIFGNGDPVEIKYNNSVILENSFPYTNTHTNDDYYSELSLSYRKSDSVAKLSMVVYTNDVLYSSNYSQGTNFVLIVKINNFRIE